MPRLTIDLKQQGFSRESALYFANVCDLAYSDDPRAAAREVLGLDATVFNHLKSDTQGFVGRGDGFSVLAFRGSEKLNQHPKDWINDIRALQVSEDPFTGRVHAGFSRTVNAAWESVSAVLRPALQAVAAVGADDPAIPLFITGHSLGGALATFAAFRLTPGLLPAAGDNPAVRFNLRATYTFGAPRVGNVEFSKTFLVPPLYRVVNNLDLVPLLLSPASRPPASVPTFLGSSPHGFERWRGRPRTRRFMRMWKR